jgi:hypothetical protein
MQLSLTTLSRPRMSVQLLQATLSRPRMSMQLLQSAFWRPQVPVQLLQAIRSRPRGPCDSRKRRPVQFARRWLFPLRFLIAVQSVRFHRRAYMN